MPLTRKLRLILPLLVLAVAANSAAAEPVKDAAGARAEVQKMFGFVPGFIKAFPDVALPGAWEEMKTLQMNPATALTNKQKELIGLAVAAQIPCEYCVYAHTQFAKMLGATNAEIGEAVAMAGITRHWSTFMNGLLPDEAKWRADVGKAIDNFRLIMSGKVTIKKIDPVDTKTAYEDIDQWYGALAPFLKKFPPEAIAAAWREDKDVEMGQTALDGKTKALIGIAVGAQIPCRYCIIADTEFAKAMGTSEREILEAVAMASHVRNFSTLLNGLAVDKPGFKRDVDRMIKVAKANLPKEQPVREAKKESRTP